MLTSWQKKNVFRCAHNRPVKQQNISYFSSKQFDIFELHQSRLVTMAVHTMRPKSLLANAHGIFRGWRESFGHLAFVCRKQMTTLSNGEMAWSYVFKLLQILFEIIHVQEENQFGWAVVCVSAKRSYTFIEEAGHLRFPYVAHALLPSIDCYLLFLGVLFFPLLSFQFDILYLIIICLFLIQHFQAKKKKRTARRLKDFCFCYGGWKKEMEINLICWFFFSFP